jgi:hypothetical protein
MLHCPNGCNCSTVDNISMRLWYALFMKTRFKQRPLSWSQISSFHYNPEEWYKRYILNQQTPPSSEMIFGSKVGKRLETDPTFLPQIPRHSKMEHGFKVVFNGIPMVGYADSFCDQTHRKLLEYKTGKAKWDQRRVDNHGQLTMYALSNFITNKIRPEDMTIQLVWMPTKETGSFDIEFVEPIEKHIQIFTTKRTMKDILNFGAYINKTVQEMDNYCKKVIPTSEFDSSST